MADLMARLEALRKAAPAPDWLTVTIELTPTELEGAIAQLRSRDATIRECAAVLRPEIFAGVSTDIGASRAGKAAILKHFNLEPKA